MQITQDRQSDNAIEDQQLAILLNNTQTTNIGNVIIACLAYLVLQGGFKVSGFLNPWFLTILFLVFIRYLLGQQHRKYFKQIDSRDFLNRYVLATFFIGLAWGLLPLLQYQTDNYATQNFVFMFIIGIIAASVASLSVWLPSLIFFIIPQMLGLVTVFILLGDHISLILAIGVVIYTGIIGYIGRNISYRTRDFLILQSHNNDLIESLNIEIDQRKSIQEQLENHKTQLEEIVDTRTQELKNSNKKLEKEIDERRLIESNLQFLAHHDPLTNLPNRSLLIDRIEHAISIAQRKQTKIVLLFLDLDRFKNINDSLGHSIGDKLLLEVSGRLKMALRSSDTIARNGGDEFVVLLENIKHAEFSEKAAKKIIRTITDVFTISGHEIHIGISIGISVYPTDGSDPITLLRNADTAMYKAKQTGGNTYQYYAENMSQSMRERLDIENKLHSAIENNEFYMVYQPQIDSITQTTVGFESLIRWHNPQLGLVPPDIFIPIVEDTGLIYDVGNWIIRTVAQFISTGKAGTAKVAINLSTLQLHKSSFSEYVKNTINEFSINPSQIEFEITESLLIENFESTNNVLCELNDLGCTIALDDFGTGYTSMSYLARLPIDIIKVDRSFINNIEDNISVQSIVHAIITMSKSLKITNIIEGIENKSQLEIVQKLGGNIIQGYYFSTPLKEKGISEWFSKESKLQVINQTTT